MTDNYRWVVLVALSLIVFIINVDYTAVNLALIPVAAELQADINIIQWVLSGYVLAWAVCVIPAGNFSDRYSKKYFCLVGLSLFLLASLLAGLANSANLLIAARILQGMAGAIYVPSIYALIYLNFTEHERGRAIGMMSLGVGAGMAVGPFVGGVLLSVFNWRSIFFINIPIGLIALAIIYASKKDEVAVNNHRVSSIPLQLFRNLPFLGVVIGILLEQFGFSAIIVSIGLFLQKVMQFSVLKSSLVYLALTIIFGIIAAASGPWIDRAGLRIPVTAGLFLLSLGSFLFILLSAASPMWLICLIFIILGVGMGLAFSGLNTGIVKTVAGEYIGIASSVFLLCALLGNTFGVFLTTLMDQHASLSYLLHVVTGQQFIANTMQIQQLANYIANIGAQGHNLSAFSHGLQKLVIINTVPALNAGIIEAMLLNAIICLIAMFTCARLLNKQA